jgi:hypothetical protein
MIVVAIRKKVEAKNFVPLDGRLGRTEPVAQPATRNSGRFCFGEKGKEVVQEKIQHDPSNNCVTSTRRGGRVV